VIRDLASAFEKKYGIKVEWVNGRGEELTQRMQTEKTAGISTVDVVMSGDATTLTVLKPRGLLGKIGAQLILPEVTDPQAWITKHVPFYDKDQMGIAMLATPQRYVIRNTAMVNDHELTSYKDLLNPKWKGKITMNDPTVTGTGNAFLTMLAFNLWGVEGAKEFMRQLVKQEPAITRDRRLQAEWVARGKYAISIATNFENAIEFMNLGSPIAFAKVKEGGKIGSGAGGLSVPETPAHPNASKVFINWILSKEGHAVFVKTYGSPGSRRDAPREGVPPQMFAEPDEKFYEETEESILFRTEMMKLAKEIFAPLFK
jgi:iron(III) transport system substrate-binding protein